MLLVRLRGCLQVARSSGAVLRHAQRLTPSIVEGQRSLSTDPNIYEREPWPYQKKNFKFWHMFTDYTSSRLNDNSVIICVDGPPCCGKTEMAKSIAAEFHLKYMPGPTEDIIFNVNGFDMRDLNPLLVSPKSKAYDMEMMFHERDPSKGRLIYNTQLLFYRKKFGDYVEALKHLLNTGQGVVIENSVWSDFAYLETLYKLGYVSRNAFRHYREYRADSMYEIYKPHVVFHIEAPTSYILEQMRQKYPDFADAPGLNKDFVDTLKTSFRSNYLPYISKFSEVLSFDATDLPDLDLLMLDIERLELYNRIMGMPDKFNQWIKVKEEYWALYRYKLSTQNVVEKWLSYKSIPILPEELMDVEEKLTYTSICDTVPQLRYCRDVFYDRDGNFKDTPEVREILADSPFAPASEYGKRCNDTEWQRN